MKLLYLTVFFVSLILFSPFTQVTHCAKINTSPTVSVAEKKERKNEVEMKEKAIESREKNNNTESKIEPPRGEKQQNTKGPTLSKAPKAKKITKMKKTIKQSGLNELHSITVLGDIGQFEVFKEFKKGLIENLEHIDSQASPQTIDNVCKEFIEENKDNMMVKFRNVAKLMVESAAPTVEAVVLGDMVYPEQKKLGKNLVELRNQGLKNSKDETKPDDEKKEWKNISENLNSASQLIQADSDGKFIATSSQGVKKNPLVQNMKEKWMRLHCGWKYIADYVMKDTQNMPAWLAPILKFNVGNHTYDVDFRSEIKFIYDHFSSGMMVRLADDNGKVATKYEDMSTKSAKSYSEPRIVKANTDKLNIQYLDYDPTLLTCAEHFQEVTNYKNFIDLGRLNAYIACRKSRQEDISMPGLEKSDEDSITYRLNHYLKLKALIKALDANADWRIMRSHQPIFNPEFDFAGMKLNKEIMGLIKAAHIHVFFVSHFHNALVTLSLFERDNYKYHNVSNWNANARSQKRPSDLTENMTPYPSVWNSLEDFMFDENKKLRFANDKGEITQIVTRVDRSELVLKNHLTYTDNGDEQGVNHIDISRNNEEFVVQFLTGHSGRADDPLYNDGFSDLLILFGEGRINGNGYTRHSFYKNSSGQNCLLGTHFLLSGDMKSLNPVYKLEVCQKDDEKETDRNKIFNSLYASNFNDDVVLDHLKNTEDPFKIE